MRRSGFISSDNVSYQTCLFQQTKTLEVVFRPLGLLLNHTFQNSGFIMYPMNDEKKPSPDDHLGDGIVGENPSGDPK